VPCEGGFPEVNILELLEKDFSQAGCPSCHPTISVKALAGVMCTDCVLQSGGCPAGGGIRSSMLCIKSYKLYIQYRAEYVVNMLIYLCICHTNTLASCDA